jgi:hypothetical protein
MLAEDTDSGHLVIGRTARTVGWPNCARSCRGRMPHGTPLPGEMRGTLEHFFHKYFTELTWLW